MQTDAHFQSQLAEAEALVKKAEQENGVNDISVSYRLDAVVRLLRSKGLRLQDANEMETRARRIRVDINTGQMAKLTPLSRDISEAIRTAAKRKEEEKAKSTMITVAVTSLVLVVAVRLIYFPSAGERAATLGALKGINKVMPTTVVMDMINKGETMLNDTKEATDKHNEEVNKWLGDDATTAGTDTATDSSSDTSTSSSGGN
jgi:hypothetical protein